MRPQDFREELQRCVPNALSWLFVCEGLPFNCEIFVVGANPGRYTDKPFWQTYWTDTAGLNRSKLLADLKAINGKFTRTQEKIEELRSVVNVPILDTNVYFRDIRRLRDIARQNLEQEAMLSFMIHAIRPRLIVVHGQRALNFFRSRSPSLTEEKLRTQDACIDGVSFQVLYCEHLSIISRVEYAELRSFLSGLSPLL